jgi:hypothetical protein
MQAENATPDQNLFPANYSFFSAAFHWLMQTKHESPCSTMQERLSRDSQLNLRAPPFGTSTCETSISNRERCGRDCIRIFEIGKAKMPCMRRLQLPPWCWDILQRPVKPCAMEM